MQETTRKISPKMAPKASPKTANIDKPKRDETTLSAVVCEVRRSATFSAVGRMTQSITLELRDRKRGCVFPFSFHMGRPSEARAFQRLLGDLDFLLESGRDLDEACRHVLGATCDVRVAVNWDGPEGIEFEALSVKAAKNQLNPMDDHDPCWT